MRCGPMGLVKIGSCNGLLPIRCQAITQITKCIWKWCLQSVGFPDQHPMSYVFFYFNKNFGWIKYIVTSPAVIYGKPNGLFPTERSRKRSSSIKPSPITDLLNKCGTHAWSYLRVWIAATAPHHSKLYQDSDTAGYCCFLKSFFIKSSFYHHQCHSISVSAMAETFACHEKNMNNVSCKRNHLLYDFLLIQITKVLSPNLVYEALCAIELLLVFV